MPKTKLSKLVERIKRVKRYENKDKRCTYPFTPDLLGYCWSYALFVDGSEEKSYQEFCNEHCKNCEYWKGNKEKWVKIKGVR